MLIAAMLDGASYNQSQCHLSFLRIQLFSAKKHRTFIISRRGLKVKTPGVFVSNDVIVLMFESGSQVPIFVMKSVFKPCSPITSTIKE